MNKTLSILIILFIAYLVWGYLLVKARCNKQNNPSTQRTVNPNAPSTPTVVNCITLSKILLAPWQEKPTQNTGNLGGTNPNYQTCIDANKLKADGDSCTSCNQTNTQAVFTGIIFNGECKQPVM